MKTARWLFKGETNKGKLVIPRHYMRLSRQPSSLHHQFSFYLDGLRTRERAKKFTLDMKYVDIAYLELIDRYDDLEQSWEFSGIKVIWSVIEYKEDYSAGFDVEYCAALNFGEYVDKTVFKNHWLN